MPVGALAPGLLAPALIQRLGSAKVAAFGLVLLALAGVGVPLAGSWVVLAILMLLVGALYSLVDVAQNAHAFRVQRGFGRSIINAFHGLWSVGAVVGGLVGSAVAGRVARVGARPSPWGWDWLSLFPPSPPRWSGSRWPGSVSRR